MTDYNQAELGRQAKNLGFVRDTFEKVCRLTDVLRFFEQDEILSRSLALKGGTAINLIIFDLPRLSVDIDLDYCGHSDRQKMLADREIIAAHINKYMKANGYTLSWKTKTSYALDSFVYSYINCSKMNDNIKIEINYVLRNHVLPIQQKKINLPGLNSKLEIQSVAAIEIFASKINAFNDRAAPRDLFDIYNMILSDIFSRNDYEMLRKCSIFYYAINTSADSVDCFGKKVINISQHQIKTDLLPVLGNREFFDAGNALGKCTEYLSQLLTLTKKEQMFLSDFSQKKYRPELLFDDRSIIERIERHPMALWKCRQTAVKYDI